MMSDEAIPAATLIVMREQADARPELLMVTRTRGMAFAGGAMVFPGGRVDQADLALDDGRYDHGAARVAAIRETLEESGVPAALAPTPEPRSAAALQEVLLGGTGFADALRSAGCTIQPDQLVPFARWKPAFHQPRRFDTLFFICRAPEGEWALRPQPGECERVEWVSADEVLARIADGRASAIFPTVRNLERLAQFASFDEARAHALAHPVETISPWVEEEDGIKWLRIPEHLGYPVTRERLTDAVRA